MPHLTGHCGNSTVTEAGGQTFRALRVQSRPTNPIVATISGIKITNGAGGIYNDHATLTLNSCAISGNAIKGANGGGLYNDHGTVTIKGGQVQNNSAAPDATFNGGIAGGIYNDGSGGSATLSVYSCTLSGNSSPEMEGGGAIANYGSLAVGQCVFTGSNSAQLGSAIYNEGTATVSASTFEDQGADLAGGAIDNESATMTISGSLFINNRSAEGGAIYNNTFNGGATRLSISSSTFSGNFGADTGGAIKILGNSIVAISTSTLVNNTCGNRAGGGVYMAGSSLAIASCTFSGNSNPTAGALALQSGSVDLGNTILNAGVSGPNIAIISATVTSHGYNLSSDAGAGVLTATGDQPNTNPLLDPAGLQTNCGLTPTLALLPNSPAIDQGNRSAIAALASNTDQRGFTRPVIIPGITEPIGGDGSDIGAFEVQRPPVAQCQNVTVLAGHDGTANASIDNGSFSPEGAAFTIVQTPPGPYPLGTTPVIMTVTDEHCLSSSCSAAVTVLPDADLALTQTTDHTTVNKGQKLTYTLTVSNLGSSLAAGVVVADVAPQGSVFYSTTASPGTFTVTPPSQGGVVTFNLGSLADGTSARVSLTVVVTAGRNPGASALTNTATVTSSTPYGGFRKEVLLRIFAVEVR